MKQDISRIKEFLEEHLEETKGLSDWCYEINTTVRPRKRMTPRELAHVFNRVFKNNHFAIDHQTGPILYTFSPLTPSLH